MRCIIIAIGEELVKGEYYEINAKIIAENLSKMGISVLRVEILPDDNDTLINSIEKAMKETEILITTGGLGPTDDDLTRYAFGTALGLPLEVKEEELNRIKNLFEKNGWHYSKDNDRQAFFPKDSEIILNQKGTASGFYLYKNAVQIFTLPGVPEQAEYLFKSFIMNKLQKLKTDQFYNFTAKTQNIGEAHLNELFREKVNAKNLKWGTLSRDDGIYLKVSAYGKHAENTINKVREKVKNIFKTKIWGWDGDELPDLIAKFLKQKSLTLSTVESCTGGLIGKLLTDKSGASKFYQGGVIVYSNEMKIQQLRVGEKTIENYGAVSEECVLELAQNGREKFATDYCIAISGIAGPTGGSEEKPVGTVWIGISCEKETRAYHYKMPGGRDEVRRRSANYALGLLKSFIEKHCC